MSWWMMMFLVLKQYVFKVHSHTVITHVLKSLRNCSNSPFSDFNIWSYLHCVRVCMSVSIILSVKGSSLQEKVKGPFFFCHPVVKKTDLLLWSLVCAFLVLMPSISNKKVHLFAKVLLVCGDFNECYFQKCKKKFKLKKTYVLVSLLLSLPCC